MRHNNDNKDDYTRSNCFKADQQRKMSAEIEEQTKAFLARGGAVEHCGGVRDDRGLKPCE